MQVQRHVVSLTTNASGDVTGYTPNVSGKILSITYVKTDFANGVDFTVTAEATAEAIWTGTDVNAGTTVYPRAATHSVAGAAALFAAGGAAVNDHIHLANDRVKIVVAQGGNAKSGAVHVVIG